MRHNSGFLYYLFYNLIDNNLSGGYLGVIT